METTTVLNRHLHLAGRDEQVIRSVRRWLRAEGAISAGVCLPSGKGITVYRNKKIERAMRQP